MWSQETLGDLTAHHPDNWRYSHVRIQEGDHSSTFGTRVRDKRCLGWGESIKDKKEMREAHWHTRGIVLERFVGSKP